MDSENLTEGATKKEDETVNKEGYIEIEIPYNLYQYLNTEHCNVQNMCRICLSTENEILYPIVATNENSILSHMFMALTSIQLFPDDGLPGSICESCQVQVVQCYDFKAKCEKSDCMLKSILKGEFITKEELADHSMDVKQELSDINNSIENYDTNENNNLNQSINSVVKDELEPVEDVQYLEDSDNISDNDALCIVQKTLKSKKKKVNDSVNETKNLQSLKEITPRKRHQRKVARKEKTFPCKSCPKTFSTVKAFHAHVKTAHVNVKSHTCTQCTESFNSEHDLKVHYALHTKGNTWKCNQCPKEFNAKTTLRRHISRHMETKRHICDMCDKSFTELYALRRHTRVHTGEIVEKKHVCTICDKRYSNSGLLAAHMSRHIGLRPCECVTCGKRFPSTRLLNSHRLVHSDRKPYACSYCDKRFRHESTRNTHHRTHTGEKPYVCSTCGKSFIQNSNLTLHMRTHTGERPYACTMCDRKFTSGSTLKTHELIHSGERPYSCNVCGKKFTRKNMSAHMRLHTGERPFECSVCSKKFANATRLRDHQRVHTGEKPFDCAQCSQKFATKSQQYRHTKSHQASKKKKIENRGLVILQHVEPVPVITDRIMFNKEHGELIRVNENVSTVESPEDEGKELTLNIVQEVPLEVTGELILQDDSNVKADILVVDNSQNINNYQADNICLDTSNVDIIDDGNYAILRSSHPSDMNLVTVNEGGVSISTANLDGGTTVKLYQLDQSLVQIHSAGGQVTISKITSKMTANF